MIIGQLLDKLQCVVCRTPLKKVVIKSAADKNYKEQALFVNFDDLGAAVIDIGGDDPITVKALVSMLKQGQSEDTAYIQSCDQEKEHTTDFTVINTRSALVLMENADSKAV